MEQGALFRRLDLPRLTNGSGKIIEVIFMVEWKLDGNWGEAMDHNWIAFANDIETNLQ